jgi:hypothetical protein
MWLYDDKEFDETPEEYQGFVYIITNLTNNKKYIGKKFFWKPKTLPKTKTRKRRIKTRVESDWRTYYGSSKDVQELVENNGVESFKREILKLCKTKGECSYFEAKLQFDYDVLLRDDFYNGIISCRIHKNHVKGIKDEYE